MDLINMTVQEKLDYIINKLHSLEKDIQKFASDRADEWIETEDGLRAIIIKHNK